MNAGHSINLMDHVFGMLEQYANKLEEDVHERTRQLEEEKRKSDILLYRMMPRGIWCPVFRCPILLWCPKFRQCPVFRLVSNFPVSNFLVSNFLVSNLPVPVEPEHFECVTVFFSDIVQFAALLYHQMRPLQVVNLMNELYTTFDALIDEHDMYKVESIGDGYLCVSGLPNRNGNLHAKECADIN
ncbi:hypothetical protein niasHT_017225 [Heterodera trifolii]|uniref:Guanylate cyclase domain-containing protein n=1 Tax=Heterodera trifolii TaxID=157864 RepID=A0ABD2L3D6_9BILA